MDNFDKLLQLVIRKYSIDTSRDWSKGSQTYFEELFKELQEVKEELEKGTGPHLEDELGDVLWDFCCLLENLEQEGKITKDNVFKRSFEKYHERISGIEEGNSWEEIKRYQKNKLNLEEKEFQNK